MNLERNSCDAEVFADSGPLEGPVSAELCSEACLPGDKQATIAFSPCDMYLSC